MLLRVVIAFFAKKIYPKDYALLKNNLRTQIEKLDIDTDLGEELMKFLISGEDHRYRYHIGFDIIAIIRAIKNRLLYKKIEGASTIEQQLVRVLTNNYERTFSRKIKEILLSTTVIEIISKDKIPLIYLNIAYYGTEMNGLNAAVNKLTMTKANLDLDILCAELVARVKYPEPKNYSELRQKQIDNRIIHLIKLRNAHSTNKLIKVYG